MHGFATHSQQYLSGKLRYRVRRGHGCFYQGRYHGHVASQTLGNSRHPSLQLLEMEQPMRIHEHSIAEARQSKVCPNG